jgi:hypothetical protein
MQRTTQLQSSSSIIHQDLERIRTRPNPHRPHRYRPARFSTSLRSHPPPERYSEKDTLSRPPSPMTEAQLLHLLRDCYTPTGPNIVAAGLVRSATLAPDPDVPGASVPNLPPRFIAAITLHAPSTDETAASQLSAQIENRLLGLPEISRVNVTLLPALFPIL